MKIQLFHCASWRQITAAMIRLTNTTAMCNFQMTKCTHHFTLLIKTHDALKQTH